MVPSGGAKVQRERITKPDIEMHGATAGCPGCNAIKNPKRPKAHAKTVPRMDREEVQENTRRRAERLDCRNSVINEPLAKEPQKSDKSDKVPISAPPQDMDTPSMAPALDPKKRTTLTSGIGWKQMKNSERTCPTTVPHVKDMMGSWEDQD